MYVDNGTTAVHSFRPTQLSSHLFSTCAVRRDHLEGGEDCCKLKIVGIKTTSIQHHYPEPKQTLEVLVVTFGHHYLIPGNTERTTHLGNANLHVIQGDHAWPESKLRVNYNI